MVIHLTVHTFVVEGTFVQILLAKQIPIGGYLTAHVVEGASIALHSHLIIFLLCVDQNLNQLKDGIGIGTRC